MEKLIWRCGAVWCGVGVLLSGANAQTAQPDSLRLAEPQRQARPAWAPRIVPPLKVDETLQRRRLLGVTPAVPATVQDVARQSGDWFMPLFGPGMTAPYDLRGWHPHSP